jgi:phosphatidylserine/phosphatidylglycerophosphate/cardiolipin synthase-like enzyme
MSATVVRAYASPTCVLLAFDWSEGANYPDFLGFAIERNPGYGRDGKAQYLLNKLDFVPITAKSVPKPSDRAPIQKFNWWDGGIVAADRGRKFTYRVTPVRGSGPNDLKLQTAAAGSAAVTVPPILDGKIASYFNRAVVSAQSFAKLTNGGASLEKQMDWLANGLQDAVSDILGASQGFDCAIYHLNDQRWVLPTFKAFTGKGSLVYFDKPADQTSQKGLKTLGAKPNISVHKRSRISGLMHDKFIVSYDHGRETSVLMGSANFTPEAMTMQANLLHIIHSPQLADLYTARANLLAGDPTTAATAKGAGWVKVTDLPGTGIRVFFAPEGNKGRTFLDTVTQAVAAAKSSVLFCMFTATDSALMNAIFKLGDRPDRLIYGLLNTIDDPAKPTKSGKPRKATPISIEIFHRSQADKLTLSYDYFRPGTAPAGFLPEFNTIDVKKYSGGKGPPVAVHIHHKFIVIDGDTPQPTIYTGSANFSKNSESNNDENLLEISGNATLAQVYVAEFLRLYNHYRARALWNRSHPQQSGAGTSKSKNGAGNDPLVLASTRDGWVNGAYKPGTKEYVARERLL